MVPFKTDRNLKRGDLSETYKDKEHPRPPAERKPAASILVPCIFLFSLLLVLSLCLFVASGVGVLRSLLPTSMFRAPIDEPGFPPIDIRDHTECAVRALMPTLASSPPHVCHRQGTGLSPMARTCSRTWVFIERLRSVHVRKPRSKKMATIFLETQLSFVRIAKRVFRHLQGKRKSVPQTNTSAM